MKNAIYIGLAIGVITTLISIIVGKIAGYSSMFSISSIVISMLVTLVLMIFIGRKYLRPSDGDGILYFGEALKYLFVAILCTNAVSTVATTLIYANNTEVEKAFEKYTQSASEKGLELGMKASGASDDEIELKLEEYREQYESGEIPKQDYPFSMSKIPLNFLMSSIFGLVYALIAAFFVKKNE